MGGRMSRNKGKRLEYAIRDHLRSLGFPDAVRVPLSGASEGFKGDVLYTDHQGKKITIEAKSRKAGFTTLYKKFVNTVIEHPDLGGISVYNFEEINAYSLNYIACSVIEDLTPREEGIFNTLYLLKQEADMLIVKDNNKPMLLVMFGVNYEEE